MVDLKQQYFNHKMEFDRAVQDSLSNGQYIGGVAVASFEAHLSDVTSFDRWAKRQQTQGRRAKAAVIFAENRKKSLTKNPRFILSGLYKTVPHLVMPR